MTQSEATQFCAKQGMTLVSIKNVQEQSILQSIAVGKTLNGNRKFYCLVFFSCHGLFFYLQRVIIFGFLGVTHSRKVFGCGVIELQFNIIDGCKPGGLSQGIQEKLIVVMLARLIGPAVDGFPTHVLANHLRHFVRKL